MELLGGGRNGAFAGPPRELPQLRPDVPFDLVQRFPRLLHGPDLDAHRLEVTVHFQERLRAVSPAAFPPDPTPRPFTLHPPGAAGPGPGAAPGPPPHGRALLGQEGIAAPNVPGVGAGGGETGPLSPGDAPDGPQAAVVAPQG